MPGDIRPIKPGKFEIRGPNKTSPAVQPGQLGNKPGSDKDFSKLSRLGPEEVNSLHNRSDLDKSDFAQHHTLGPKKNQASPGNHTHDGITSRSIGYGLNLTLTGAKGGNVALTNLIAMLKNMGFVFTDSTT